LISCSATFRARSIGITRPNSPPVRVVMPTTAPDRSTIGPPDARGEITASVEITS
jgi:hypothetical protein